MDGQGMGIHGEKVQLAGRHVQVASGFHGDGSLHYVHANGSRLETIGYRERCIFVEIIFKSLNGGGYLAIWRVRISFVALVRSVSGTFLLFDNFLRSTAFSDGNMCRVTSRGVLELFMRLRITV